MEPRLPIEPPSEAAGVPQVPPAGERWQELHTRGPDRCPPAAPLRRARSRRAPRPGGSRGRAAAPAAESGAARSDPSPAARAPASRPPEASLRGVRGHRVRPEARTERPEPRGQRSGAAVRPLALIRGGRAPRTAAAPRPSPGNKSPRGTRFWARGQQPARARSWGRGGAGRGGARRVYWSELGSKYRGLSLAGPGRPLIGWARTASHWPSCCRGRRKPSFSRWDGTSAHGQGMGLPGGSAVVSEWRGVGTGPAGLLAPSQTRSQSFHWICTPLQGSCLLEHVDPTSREKGRSEPEEAGGARLSLPRAPPRAPSLPPAPGLGQGARAER